jgi:hypothetical protein
MCCIQREQRAARSTALKAIAPQNPAALPKANGAPTEAVAMMTGRDVFPDDACTDGPTATVAPSASASEESTDDHPTNAYQANGSPFF